ncbi:hypothetical protein JVU11DRAFT_4491 [Chiua virens]|nr:hypothetical protein JVU11DRAFT_4491 [Chiua virens]
MVSILAIFRIVPCKDEHGIDIPVIPKWTAGITSHPHDFPCRFVPRTPGGLTAMQFAQVY